MRKNNLKKLKKNSEPAANVRGEKSLNGSTRPKSDLKTPSKPSKARLTRASSSPKGNWKDDPVVDQLLQEGIDCKNSADFPAAIVAFKKTIARAPKCSLAYWLLGGIHYVYLENAELAIPYYTVAVELAPKSEKCSLGLFHALYRANRTSEALLELKRFQSIAHSDDYQGILDDMAEEGLSELPLLPKKKAKRVKTPRRSAG